MTKQEFDNTAFTAGMHFKKPDGKISSLFAVDFDLRLFGTTSANHLDLDWFEIDKCELITELVKT